jgi:release factor glutamine methyltransferase
MSSVYEPREDSELLARHVRQLARGRVLDMGTGSGIQALTALERDEVTEIVAADVNPLAVEFVTRKVGELPSELSDKVTIVQSDMFSALGDEQFDTIICNPPYLPDEEKDHDPALYGGPGGYEWSVRFLQEAKLHLRHDGQILFLFSSLTNRDRIDLELKRLGYAHEELGMLADFFERLYVYRIWVAR